MNQHIAFIGLGSNLNNPQQQLRNAVRSLHAVDGIGKLEASSLYRSRAIGPGVQPDYLNAVVKIETTLEPAPLLEQLQAIETRQHRVRAEHWGPRTIDLDLLFFDEVQLNTPRLTLPHPRIGERNFVLVPLLDLNCEATIGQHSIAELAEQNGKQDLELLERTWHHGHPTHQ